MAERPAVGSPGNLPSGVVTFLFTDIEGSTRAWEAHPTEMKAALRRHDALMRRAIEAAGGSVFKTVGDAFCAAFADAASAIQAAAALQRAILAEPWPEATPIRVRMAVHSGTCDERDGDYFGPTVNRVARLLAVAHGGQTISSGAAVALIDRLPSGVELRDLGEHRLKDLGRSEHVFQVVAEGLDASFPPLRSLDSPALRHNLPAVLTTFVGRERELVELDDLLRSTRLTTLTGPGGAGKTRLALQAAAASLDRWPDGVWIVELAPVADAGLVAATVASTLGVRDEAGRGPLGALVEWARTRELLLVLDNCEHVVETAAALVHELLRSCGGVTVLATSRERLDVPGEHIVRVWSLGLPETDETDPARIGEYGSVRLFVDRVRLHAPGFALDAATALTVARLCRRLDGLPLALELAAARTRSMDLDEIDVRLDQRFRLLTGGGRTAPRRQQTLEAALGWSYELLSPAEQLLFARLSVFAGGWDLGAAEVVCADAGPGGGDVVDGLASLVDKSLVASEIAGGDARYGMLETARAYATDRLRERGREVVATRRAHRDHFLSVAEAVAPGLRGTEPGRSLKRLQVEQDNMRAALSATMEEDAIELGLRLSTALAPFWNARGLQHEGVDALEPLLSHGADQEVSGLLRGRAALELALLLQQVARYAEAARWLDEALSAGRRHDDDALAARTLAALTFLAYLEGDVGAALAWGEEAIEIARRTGEAELVATALARQADAFDIAGDQARTRVLLEEALAMTRHTPNRTLLAMLLNNAAEAALHFDDLDVAQSRLEEAIAVGEDIGNVALLTYAQRNLAAVLLARGDAAGAAELLRASLKAAVELGLPLPTAYAIAGLAEAVGRLGDEVAAATLHGAADALLAEFGLTPEPLENARRVEDQARARASMGDVAFDAAYRRGGALARPDAIRVALGDVPELDRGRPPGDGGWGSASNFVPG